MSIIRFRPSIVAATIALGVVGALAGSTSAQANPWDYDVYDGASAYEAVNCVANWDVCQEARKAAGWSFSVTAWKFPGEDAHNTRADAFRHCAWSGAMAQRLGYGTAVEVLSNHEAASGNQPQDEYDMDISNNAVGATLGYQSNSESAQDKWGWVMDRCEELAKSGQLTTLR